MADQDDVLLAIDVDAETAAGDVPSMSRTFQTEADFQAIKDAYQARQDGSNTYTDLISAIPILRSGDLSGGLNGSGLANGHAKVKLGKKDVQLLGYAVGEMYFDKDYEGLLELCDRVRARCELDEKTGESLERWQRRCRERLG